MNASHRFLVITGAGNVIDSATTLTEANSKALKASRESRNESYPLYVAETKRRVCWCRECGAAKSERLER